MEQQDVKKQHISYKDYQKKVTKKPNEGIAIFVSVFFILLLLFLGIAKQISPDIDVSIGEENNSDEKSVIDDRLKLLQQEDSGDNMFSPELDEKVVVPKDKNAAEEVPANDESVKLPDNDATPKPTETASPAPKEQATISKVVVGYYSTKEQAEVAKGILSESGLNINPFVRSIGGAYTIQIGSYSTREKAQSVANDLLRNNYPARIISE